MARVTLGSECWPFTNGQSDFDIEAATVVTSLDDWRLSVFGNRMFMLRMPDRYLTLAHRTLIDFVVQKARGWEVGSQT